MKEDLTLHQTNSHSIWRDRNGKVRKQAWEDPHTEFHYDAEGHRHREDGPAVIDGDWIQWFWHGNPSSQQEVERLVRLKAFW